MKPGDLVEAEYVDAFRVRRRVPRAHLDAVLRAMGIDPRARPENLSPADYVRIARHLREDADS